MRQTQDKCPNNQETNLTNVNDEILMECREKHKKSKELKGKLTLLQWNKGNAPFLNRIDELKVMIETNEPQIFAVTEARISPITHIPSMQVDGYKLELDNMTKAGMRGQVAMYIVHT